MSGRQVPQRHRRAAPRLADSVSVSAVSSGKVPRVTAIVRSVPPRSKRRLTVVPGALAAM